MDGFIMDVKDLNIAKGKEIMSENTKVVYQSSGIGWIVAAVLSYTMHGSVGWAIFAAILNWTYVIYYLIVYGFVIGPFRPF